MQRVEADRSRGVYIDDALNSTYSHFDWKIGSQMTENEME